MAILIGILSLAFCGLLYAGQAVSVVNLPLAQRLGLQEEPGSTDPLFTRLEVWTARWDLLWLWTLPVAGILILADHSWWPYAAMVGGGAWIDTGGREGAKWLGVRQHGVNVGTLSDQRKYASVLSLMIVIGALAIVTGLVEVV